jgi:hypothetical protein
MVTILCALISIFEFRVRSRASLELELIALRHQVTVLRRQRPGRPRLSSLDWILWVWLYRIWPQVIDAMVLVKPATVVQWHRKGFRLYWRWRSRRPKSATNIPSECKIAIIGPNDTMILPHDANPGRIKFSERTAFATRICERLDSDVRPHGPDKPASAAFGSAGPSATPIASGSSDSTIRF